MDAKKYNTLSRHLLALIFETFDNESLVSFYEQFRKKIFELK